MIFEVFKIASTSLMEYRYGLKPGDYECDWRKAHELSLGKPEAFCDSMERRFELTRVPNKEAK